MSTQLDATTNLRAGDRERDETTARLAHALALGYLTQDEFDERSTAALRAVTLADLAGLQADLPGEVRPARPTDQDVQQRRQRHAGIGLLAHAGGFGVAVVIMLAIWVITAVAYGPYYFWPVWPILGGAVGLVGHAFPVRFGPCHRPAALRRR